LLWWIPADTETGVLVEDRYSIEVGDAMAPTMVAVGILIVSLALIAGAWLGRTKPPADEQEQLIGISPDNFKSVLWMVLLLAGSLVFMRWGGPAVLAVLRSLGADLPEYRLLSATVPYKYIGFASGGFVMVAGLISWIEGRLSWRAVLIALGAVTGLILIYDVPFNSLLLPPNGSLG
ncbi:MAG: hypothetical protein AAF441_18190, partial [Pseudomonadota bacterium]